MTAAKSIEERRAGLVQEKAVWEESNALRDYADMNYTALFKILKVPCCNRSGAAAVSVADVCLPRPRPCVMSHCFHPLPQKHDKTIAALREKVPARFELPTQDAVAILARIESQPFLRILHNQKCDDCWYPVDLRDCHALRDAGLRGLGPDTATVRPHRLLCAFVLRQPFG